MALSAAPDIQPMRNAADTQQMGQAMVFSQANIMVAHGENELHHPVAFEKPLIGDMGNVIHRIIKIEIIIVIPVHE